MWLHIKFPKQVRQKKIHLASNLQDTDKSSSLENPACTKLTEPSLAASLLPKNTMSNVSGEGEEKRVKEVVMNMNKKNNYKK